MIANGLLIGGVPGAYLALSTCSFDFVKLKSNIMSFVVGGILIELLANTGAIDNEIGTRESIIRSIVYLVSVEFVFYWSHRLQHMNKFLYKHVHRHHHLEMNPKPIDAYVLSPVEAIIVTLCFMFPNFVGLRMHKVAFDVTLAVHTFFGVCIHGEKFTIKYLNHHMIHHQRLNCWYSGPIPIWDYVFSTN